jgi:uncharacterized protein
MKSSFAYKLIPPRPSFPAGMTHAEAAITQDHFVYWQKLLSQGTAVVYGRVADPVGAWGLAMVEAGTADEVRALGAADPAVASGMSSFEVYAMPGAIVRS